MEATIERLTLREQQREGIQAGIDSGLHTEYWLEQLRKFEKANDGQD